MRKPPRALVVAVALPFLTGCIRTIAQPVPEPAARPSTSLRGVVLGDADDGERVEYRTIEHVEWTDSTVALTGIVRGPLGSAPVTTTTYRLSDVGGVLVRTVDANRTSFIIAGVLVGASVVAMLLFGGETTDQTVF